MSAGRRGALIPADAILTKEERKRLENGITLMPPPSKYFSELKPKPSQYEGKRQMQDAFGDCSPAKRLCQNNEREKSTSADSNAQSQTGSRSGSDSEAQHK